MPHICPQLADVGPFPQESRIGQTQADPRCPAITKKADDMRNPHGCKPLMAINPRLATVLLLLFLSMLLAPSCRKVTGNPPAAGSTPPWNCGAGEEWCGGRCVNTNTFLYDAANCGRCNNHCSMSETCTGGSCTCAPGFTTCMGRCVDASAFISDSNNCGRCGNQCSIGESCMGGACMKTP